MKRELFRALYIREGKPRGITFSAVNAAMAANFAYTVLQQVVTAAGGGDILTVTLAKPARPRLKSQLALGEPTR